MSRLRFEGWEARVVPRGGEIFTISLDGEACEVRLLDWEGGLLSFEVDGRRSVAAVEAGRDGAEVCLEGRRVVFFRAGRRPPAGPPGEVRAEMAGKVVEVRVKAGDRVAPGDVLLVAETMKMEHPLRAEAAAQVAGVFVSEGDRIRPGERLIALKPLAPDG